MNAPVTAVIDGKLLAGGAVRPAQALLEYSQTDPWAVWARFRAGAPGDPAAVDFEWALARDLLSAGLHAESGQGAVRVRPWTLPRRRRVVMIEMLTPTGPVGFTTPAAGVRRFLKAARALVPPGTEPRHLDLDAGIATLLAGWLMSAARPGGPSAPRGRPAGPLLPVLPARLALPDLPRAVCKGDPAPWEPGPGHQTGQDAKQACAGCPERAPCLAWALNKGEQDGIWGGTTPDERKAILRRHRETSGAVA